MQGCAFGFSQQHGAVKGQVFFQHRRRDQQQAMGRSYVLGRHKAPHNSNGRAASMAGIALGTGSLRGWGVANLIDIKCALAGEKPQGGWHCVAIGAVSLISINIPTAL